MNQKRITDWSALRPRLARYLPASLFHQLRTLPNDLKRLNREQLIIAQRLLIEAVRALSPLHRVLVDYMPRYLLETDPTPGQPHGEIIRGSFIFADVSGFTALTELLASQGDARGRELMHTIMNRLFSSVIDPISASGGDILIFVGDAALVYFPEEPNGHDVLQATRACLRMQRAIDPFRFLETDYGKASLMMSIGVERGEAYAGIVGTTDRMELLISGPGTYGAMKAEIQAEPGQVVLGPQAQAIAATKLTLQGPIVVDDLGDQLGDYEITPPTRRRGSALMLDLDIPSILESLHLNVERIDRLAPFLPEDMLALLVNTDRRREIQSEFRPVAVQFINILGIEELAQQKGPKFATIIFQRYFNITREIVAQHEGIVSQIDAYIQGFFFLNTFGVPKANEGTPRYAVAAALHLAYALERVNWEFEINPPLQLRGGITYGLTFNGEIGANYRRESVIAGPAVNRAARLMSKAQPGQIILDLDIWERTRNAFVGEALPPAKLKGIDKPVVIVNVREIRRGSHLPPLKRPIINRTEEHARLSKALTLLTHKQQATAWAITGETGIGKTTLLSSIAELARKQGVQVLAGYCQPHSKHIPLFAWIDLLTGWLRLEQNLKFEEQLNRLSESLEELKLPSVTDELADLLSLPSEALFDHLDEHTDEELTSAEAILTVLHRLAVQHPLLIVLEDVHWLDTDSWLLTKKLLDGLKKLPIMLILSGHSTLEHADLTAMPLPPLAESDLITVATRALGAEKLDEALAEWLSQRAEGNPLYAEALAQKLHQAKVTFVDKSTGEIRWSGTIPPLPLTLHELLLARLDELPLPQQELLKRCAVLGLSTEYEALVTLCHPQLTQQEVQEALEGAIQNGFLTADTQKKYQFQHNLMQEAIYVTLSFKQRQLWHATVGDWLVDNQQNHDQHLDTIAYHYLHSTDAQKGAKYGRLAGDKAREHGSYAGAVDFYRQVYELTDASERQRMRAAESQADVLALQGEYEAAIGCYEQAITLNSKTATGKKLILKGDLAALQQAEFSAQLQPWGHGAQAWLLAQAGQPAKALQLARPALKSAEGAADTALSVLIQTLEQEKKPLEPYEAWLKRFVNAILRLGVSTIDLLDMPETQSKIINQLVRKRKMKLKDIAAFINHPPDQAQQLLDELVEQGHIKRLSIKNDVWYKARFARKAEKKLSSDLWAVLDF